MEANKVEEDFFARVVEGARLAAIGLCIVYPLTVKRDTLRFRETREPFMVVPNLCRKGADEG